MAVAEVTGRTFRQEVLESDLPVVVDFYADWCAPCRVVSPVVERLSREWDGRVRFLKLDIDRSPEVAQALRISSIPTIVRFDQGRPTAWSVGAKPGHLIERELGLHKLRRRREKREAVSGGPLSRLRLRKRA